MAKLIVTAFLSLDGVMQAPGGANEDTSGGFTQGGWFIPLFDEKMGSLIGPLLHEAGSFLMGRTTYEIFASHWGKVTAPDDPIATVLNKAPKYVVSTTLERADWNATTILKDDIVARIRTLKEADGKPIVVQGSSKLIKTLTAHDLVDEYYLWFAPVLVGKGKRMFDETGVPGAFELVESHTSTTGVIIARYRRAGELRRADAPSPEELNAK